MKANHKKKTGPRRQSGKRPVVRAKKALPAAASSREPPAMQPTVTAAAPQPQDAPPAVSDTRVAPSSPAQRAGLKLESSFTLRDANDMLFQLLAVDFGESVLVDGGTVERIDTAGLQMLIAFAKYHAARGKSLSWTAVSPELLRSSQLLGLTTALHLDSHLNEGAAGGH